jgi:hypothetical protein
VNTLTELFHPVSQFKLLRGRFAQENLDSFAEIPLVPLLFQGQEYSRRKAQPFRHCNDRVKTRDFLAAFNISPKLARQRVKESIFRRPALGAMD